MSRHHLPESSFRHYTRVRIGATGPKGRLLRCRKRDNTGYYWRIRLENGAWEWPDDRMVLDGPGDRVATCADCGLRYMTDGQSPLCPTCDTDGFGRAHDPTAVSSAHARARVFGNATPGFESRPREPTAEDLAAAAELRKRDQDETPF